MPRIKVEARDQTQRHLKVLLEGLAGKIKLPLTSKTSMDNYPGIGASNYGRNSQDNLGFANEGKSPSNSNSLSPSNFSVGAVALPNINYRDKKKELMERENKEIINSLKQFNTLKDLNETLLRVPHIQSPPPLQQKHSLLISDSRASLFSLRRDSGFRPSLIGQHGL